MNRWYGQIQDDIDLIVAQHLIHAQNAWHMKFLSLSCGLGRIDVRDGSGFERLKPRAVGEIDAADISAANDSYFCFFSDHSLIDGLHAFHRSQDSNRISEVELASGGSRRPGDRYGQQYLVPHFYLLVDCQIYVLSCHHSECSGSNSS